MNVSCDVILDLIPLVKDGVASKESINLVSDHLKNCENCKLEFDSNTLPVKTEPDDKKVISTIKKKLFLAMSVLLLIGALIGMTINKNSSSTPMPAIIVIIGIVSAGIAVFKFGIKGGSSVNRFFIGRAIGTIIVFVILGIYLLLKYALQLF